MTLVSTGELYRLQCKQHEITQWLDDAFEVNTFHFECLLEFWNKNVNNFSLLNRHSGLVVVVVVATLFQIMLKNIGLFG